MKRSPRAAAGPCHGYLATLRSLLTAATLLVLVSSTSPISASSASYICAPAECEALQSVLAALAGELEDHTAAPSPATGDVIPYAGLLGTPDFCSPPEGVKCNADGAVSEIDLTDRGLMGWLPQALSQLNNLTALYVIVDRSIDRSFRACMVVADRMGVHRIAM